MSFVANEVLSLFEERPILAAFLLTVGTLSFFKFFYKTFVAFSQTFLAPGYKLTDFGAKKGAWAIVTGASDGIGREFALQLGKSGFNVMVIARNMDALKSVADEIQSKYSVQTKVKVIDFVKADDATYTDLAKECSGLRLGVLVNNVGASHSIPVHFTETPLDEMKRIVDINITATLRVTHTILPFMVQQRNGLVLNIGSFAGSTPCALLSTYSASKAFLSHFSDALAQEVKEFGVVVQHVNTYFVVSKLSKIRRPSLFIPTPKPFVQSVLSKVGLACGAAYTGRPATLTPYWTHSLMDWVMHVADWKYLHMSSNYNTQRDIRRRALAKKAREEKGQ